ncbi:MAG: DUF1553 domain-containing protein, partial [Planctomycetales bacterium]|nr:DUF1553 domain-containing protein [Planctomycetales bacterium]
PDSQPKLAEFDKRMGEVRAKKPREEFLRACVEPAGHVPETRLFYRGDYRQPKQAIAPAALRVAIPDGSYLPFPINDPLLRTTGRRLAFAQWMTARENPLFARVMVNRIWMHHFGQGLVATPADFGSLGARPTNLPLLDWLADEFMSSGWSLKSLHRLILSSTAWRQRVATSDAVAGVHRQLIRLDAETLRDRILAASGQLDARLFGPPLSIEEDETGQVVVGSGQPRRSLYIKARRSQPVAMLQAFDAPVMETNCEVRPSSTVATQSLMLLNGQFILEQAAHLADRVAGDVPAGASGLGDQITEAWQRAYCRPPSSEESLLAQEFVAAQVEMFRRHPESLPAGRSDLQQAVTNLCQALLSSNEFLYVE